MQPRPLKKALDAALQAIADPERAPEMQAYMRSETPFRGVTAPMRKRAVREVLLQVEFKNFEHWQTVVYDLWDKAKFREDRYAVLDLLDSKISRPYRTLNEALPIYETLVVSGAWWDYVDAIASHHVGGVLAKNPTKTTSILRKWAKDPDLWKRRTAILSQLRRKADTDTALLTAAIAPSLEGRPYMCAIGTKEGPTRFFLRKAIGWSLREYARQDLEWVVQYVHENLEHLHRLSIREALKHHKSRIPS